MAIVSNVGRILSLPFEAPSYYCGGSDSEVMAVTLWVFAKRTGGAPGKRRPAPRFPACRLAPCLCCVSVAAAVSADFTDRFPFIAMAVASLPARSCLIDGEAIATDANGLAVFDLIRARAILSV
jgi:hypothetical protein